MILNTFSGFISNNTHTSRELLPNKSKHIFRFHIKHYSHFEGVTPKQYYTLFQSFHQTMLAFSESYWHTIPHFSRVYIKQYWHFQRVRSKLSYSKTFFQSSYHTILTLSESYYQTVTYLELISNSIHTFKELLPNSGIVNTFLSFIGHLYRQKILREKIPK